MEELSHTVSVGVEGIEIVAKYNGDTYHAAGYTNYGGGIHEFRFDITEGREGPNGVSHIYVAFVRGRRTALGLPVALDDFFRECLTKKIPEGIEVDITQMKCRMLKPEIEPDTLKALEAAVEAQAPKASPVKFIEIFSFS